MTTCVQLATACYNNNSVHTGNNAANDLLLKEYSLPLKNKKLSYCQDRLLYKLTIRSVTAVDRLSLTVTLNMTYLISVNRFIWLEVNY